MSCICSVAVVTVRRISAVRGCIDRFSSDGNDRRLYEAHARAARVEW
jgi:hypothetical protein